MKILLVGSGGYAQNYIRILLDRESPEITWEGIVDPYYAPGAYHDRIRAKNIPIFGTMEEFYDSRRADLAVICTPTFLHCRQSVFAMSKGSDVLCEKPAAATVAEVERMRDAQKRYGKFLAIGFQWSYSATMRNLKADILGGVFGRPQMLKTFISWPRSKSYYNRGGGWGGRIQKDGNWILDSIASNACAHYLHNMLFLLGGTMQTSASVEDLQADCFRANAIENFDTCTIDMQTREGARLYFAATHAARGTVNPTFVYRFEKGEVRYAQDAGENVVAYFKDGTVKNYGNPFEDSFRKLWDCVEAVENGTVPVCTAETALPHVEVIERLYKTTPVRDIPQERILLDEETQTVYVPGLLEEMLGLYETEERFSQKGTE